MTDYSSTSVVVGKHKYYIDGFLHENLDRAKDLVKKDWDVMGLYDGYEGSGKSVKAMQDAYYLDHSFNLDRVCFDAKKFKKAVLEAKMYQAAVYDEGFSGLSSREALGRINRTLVKLMAEIRQKRLFILIVMPTFFDLDKNIALWRSRYLIHVYTGDDNERGSFSFYGMNEKKVLYVLGKKTYSYSKPSPVFRGKFTNYYVLDEDAYRKAKYKGMQSRQKDEAEKELQREVDRALFLKLAPYEGLSGREKARILGIHPATYFDRLKKLEQE